MNTRISAIETAIEVVIRYEPTDCPDFLFELTEDEQSLVTRYLQRNDEQIKEALLNVVHLAVNRDRFLKSELRDNLKFALGNYNDDDFIEKVMMELD